MLETENFGVPSARARSDRNSCPESVRKQAGLTLVEVMVVVAVIGILASFAVPGYQNYVKRAKVTEAVNLLVEAQLAMNSYHMKHGEFVPNYTNLSKRNLEVGLQDARAYKTDVVERMWVGSAGVVGKAGTSAHIAITFNPDLALSGGGTARLLSTIEFKNGSYEFICGNTASRWKTNIDSQFLPSACRN